ncbi:MAG: hypothetical protein ABW168_23960 [Sedimenticola sp.]
MDAGEYAWSSFGARIGSRDCSGLDVAPGMETMLANEERCADSYISYIKAAVPEGEWDLIRSAVGRGQLTGDGRFTEEIQQITGRRIEHIGRGRPSKRP